MYCFIVSKNPSALFSVIFLLGIFSFFTMDIHGPALVFKELKNYHPTQEELAVMKRIDNEADDLAKSGGGDKEGILKMLALKERALYEEEGVFGRFVVERNNKIIFYLKIGSIVLCGALLFVMIFRRIFSTIKSNL